MQIGLNIMPVPAAQLGEVGQLAEELGFSGLYYGEHIAVPTTLKTPYPGKVGYNARTRQLECYVALGHLAAVTRKVRLGTGITILPLRHPLQVARAIMTVDQLSGGRFDLIIGVGSIEDEFDVMGVDYKTRGARTDEWLDILGKLWTEKEPSHQGRFMSFPPIGFEPKPVQKPGPPLYVGSHSLAGLERAARRADGWYGAVYGAEQMQQIKAMVEPLLKKNGRDPASFKYLLIHAAGEAILPSDEELAAYEAAGVESVIISPFDLREPDARPRLEAAAKALRTHLAP